MRTYSSSFRFKLNRKTFCRIGIENFKRRNRVRCHLDFNQIICKSDFFSTFHDKSDLEKNAEKFLTVLKLIFICRFNSRSGFLYFLRKRLAMLVHSTLKLCEDAQCEGCLVMEWGCVGWEKIKEENEKNKLSSRALEDNWIRVRIKHFILNTLEFSNCKKHEVKVDQMTSNFSFTHS